MVILIKFFKGAQYVDEQGYRYTAKTTCIIKKTPFGRRFFLTNGMEVSRNTCFEKIR